MKPTPKKLSNPQQPPSPDLTVEAASNNLKRATEQLDESREFLKRDESIYALACQEFDNAVAAQRKACTR